MNTILIDQLKRLELQHSAEKMPAKASRLCGIDKEIILEE